MGRVQITASRASVREILSGRGRSYAKERAEEVKRLCQQDCPEDTGTLKREHKVLPTGLLSFRILADTRYASFVFDGHGPEGPRKPNRWMTRGLDRARVASGR